ncbi:MAG: hypothetical protein ACKOLA_05440, partial [Spartobacteria bacterium]
DFEKAVGRQVVIANEYLGGKKLTFLWLPIVPGTDRAEEMFASIIKNAPFSKTPRSRSSTWALPTSAKGS